MFSNFFLIFFFNTIVVISSENDSPESKYIDLLPESEKKEFIERIARRILTEVSSTELHKNGSVEISDSQLSTHQAYVARLLKEESKNLRRRHRHGSVKQLDSRRNVKKDEDKTTPNATTTDKAKTIEKELSEINDQENKTSNILPTAELNEKKQLDVNKTDKKTTYERIDLTLRVHEEINATTETTTTTTQQAESNANGQKKETISIEIEITDKNDVDPKGIPVKVVYDDKKELNNNGVQTTENTSTSKDDGKDIANLEKKSRRFSLDTQIETIPNVDSQQTLVGGQNLLRTNDTTPKEGNDDQEAETESNNNKEIKSNSTITIKPEVLREIMQEVFKLENITHSESDNLKTNQDNQQIVRDNQQSDKKLPQNELQELDVKQKSENEISRQKRTSTIEEKINKSSETNANMTQTTETINMETEYTSIPSESSTLIITASTDSAATTTPATAETSDIPKADPTTVFPSSERNLEAESPTKLIPFGSDSSENITIETSTVNSSTTEEIIKARTKFVSGYPSDETNDETAAIPILNITKTDSDEDSDMNIKEISNSSDISTLKTSDVTDSDIITLAANANTTTEINIAKVLRNSEAEIVTSTQITPLTTSAIENQKKEDRKQFFYDMESPDAVIKNLSAIEVVEDQNTTIETIKKIVNTISKKTLRQNAKPVYDDQNRLEKSGKNKGQNKEYVVFELLPGQKPFQERSIQVGKNPQNYSKHPKWKPLSSMKTSNDHASQIDHPNYAIVYNYDPKYAYYNPNNKYGPNDDKDPIISNSNDISDKTLEIDDKLSSDSFSSKENWKLPYNYKTNQRSKPLKSSLKNIDLDYYFGLGDEEFLRTTIDCKVYIGPNGVTNLGKDCPQNERIVIQNPVVPPNSDEYDHPSNALLHKRSPVSHVRQSQIILSLLGYHGYHKIDRNNKITKVNKITDKSGSDMVEGISKGDTILEGGEGEKGEDDNSLRKPRSRSSSINLPKERYKVFNRYHKFVDEESENDNIFRESLHPRHLKNRVLNIQNERFSDKNRFHHPLIILTGNVDRNDQDEKIKTGNFVPLDFIDKNLFAESSDEKDRQDRTKLMQKYGELYYDDSDNVDELRENKKYLSFDRNEASSIKENRLQEIRDFNAAQMLLNMTEKKPAKKFRNNILQQIEEIYDKLKNVDNFKAYVKSDANEDERNSKKSSAQQLDADLNVLKDMIDQKDNKPLKKFDWLATAVDIRSALTKLQNLSVTTRLTKKFVNPKDLQLLKYVVYLYNKAQYPEENTLESLKTDNTIRYSKTKVLQAYRGSKSRRTLKLITVKDEKDDVPRNMRFLEPQKEERKGHKRLKKPWMSREGITSKLLKFEIFLRNLESALDELHDAIRHIAEITNYRTQRWYENLKELYLENPTRKKLLEVLLHLSFTRLLDLINDSAKLGLADNYVKFAIDNPKQVDQATEEFQFIVNLLNEIDKVVE